MDEKSIENIQQPDKNNKIIENPKKGEHKWIAFLIIGLLFLGAGIGCLLWTFLKPQPEIAQLNYPDIPSKKDDTSTVYSALTGEKLDDANSLNAPVFCIQTPNGTDGARPQAGLNTAGVIFEAIAEAGITRFAAIYQNPSPAVIGPIRSLRLYYLQWDTPFDCTIVHAGGAPDALAAVRTGGYKDLTENYTYMYRGTIRSRLWNNLFTTASYLKQYSTNNGYNTSEIRGFSRMTPDESKKNRVNSLVKERLSITTPATGNTSELAAGTSNIGIRFGRIPNFNVDYVYDATSNKYLRSYQSGVAHNVYNCPNEDLGERNPEDVCELTQMAPSVVIAMIVPERRASDNYHEDITTIGSGEAYVFQNGLAIKGTWNKSSVADQIKFLDESGNEIKLVPGQVIVSAVPNYGGVEF